MKKLSYVKTVGLLSYYILPLIIILTYIITLIIDSRKAYDFSALTGDWAWWLLVFLVFIRPLIVIFPKVRLFKKLCLRKQLGVLNAWLFVIHGFGTIIFKKLYHINDYAGWTNYLLWGLLAGIIMLILGMTSNITSTKRLNKLLKNGWKKLHRTTYLLFVFVAIHAYLFSNNIIYLIITATYLLLKVLEFSKVKLDKKYLFLIIIMFLCIFFIGMLTNMKINQELPLQNSIGKNTDTNESTNPFSYKDEEKEKEEHENEKTSLVSDSIPELDPRPIIDSPIIEETGLIPNKNELINECTSLCKVDQQAYCLEERTLVFDSNTYTQGSCRVFSKYVSGFRRCRGYCSSYGNEKGCNINGSSDRNCDGS